MKETTCCLWLTRSATRTMSDTRLRHPSQTPLSDTPLTTGWTTSLQPQQAFTAPHKQTYNTQKTWDRSSKQQAGRLAAWSTKQIN